jgi:predicted nucleic acid-binding protein
MKVLVDTSILSLAFRRTIKTDAELLLQAELSSLIKDFRLLIIGPIRQEILTGIKDLEKFELIKTKLANIPDSELKTEHFEQAAKLSNICRSKGIQGSSVDFLICSFAIIENCVVFTNDKDFELYQKYCPIKLYNIEIE